MGLERFQPTWLKLKSPLKLKALEAKLLLILPSSSFSSHTLSPLCIAVEAPKFGSSTKIEYFATSLMIIVDDETFKSDGISGAS